MRVLVAPQEFKGSLTADAAASAIEAGLRRALPDVEVARAPMADGGPGTLELLHGARGGERITGVCRGPLGAPVEATWVLLQEDGSARTAVVEAATTVGLVLVPPGQREPAHASSFGVGEQIASAVARGGRRIIVGIGGTGTNDGGAGAAQALGYRLLDGRGNELQPGPLALHWLSRIATDAVLPGLRDVEIVVAADVTSVLLGPAGATAMFGPQKGVSAVQAPRIEAALKHWADVVRRDLGVEIATVEGGGAGGGLAAGLVAACGARIESGAAVVADAIRLRSQLEGCDIVITGEGRLDEQTARGKTVGFVAALAAELGRPCYAVVGSANGAVAGLTGVEASQGAYSEAESVSRATELVEAAAERLGRRLASSGPAGH